MKWQSKRHEFDDYAKQLIADLDLHNKKYYIFGAGKVGRTLLPVFEAYNYTIAFIDNSVEKQQDKVNGVKVISLDYYLRKKDAPIIVAVSIKNTLSIVEQLEENDLKRGKDYFLYEEFTNYIFPVISTYYYDKVFVSLAQICVTERCTLKCRKCAHGCYAVDNRNAKDLTLEQIHKSADWKGGFYSRVCFDWRRTTTL